MGGHNRLPLVNLEELTEFMSRIAHHCWVSYQIAAGQPYNIELSEAQMLSQKNAMTQFLKDPGMTAEKNHENWMAYKLSIGWKPGPVRDEQKKESPCLVPFAELPEIEKKKDIMDIESRRFAYKLAQDFLFVG